MNPKLAELFESNHIHALAQANHRAATLMQLQGGGFASALGVAYHRADADNEIRILGAFPELFEKYRRIALELRELAD